MSGAFEVAAPGAVLRGERRYGTDDGSPPLVLIHGMAGDSADMDLFWDGLAQDRTRIRYDLRGFGASEAWPQFAFSHADDLSALLDALGIRRADLLGVSMGGAVATNFALDHPRRTNRLVLIGPALVAWDYSEEWRALWRPVAQAAHAGDMDHARALWLRHPMFDGTRDGPFGAHLAASIARYAGRQWVRDDQRHSLPDIERLHALTAPTLLVTGEHDLPDLRLTADVIAASAPHVSRYDVPDAHHLAHFDAPETVLNRIQAFLLPSPR